MGDSISVSGARAQQSGAPRPSVRVGSEVVTIRLGGVETAGSCLLFEEVTDPGGGMPLHVHDREDEACWALEGEFEFRVGERTIRATPGEFLVGPRGVPHTFQNVGAGPARKLVLAWPAGLEEFFLEVGTPVEDGADAAPPDAAALARLAAAADKYGMTLLPD